MLWLCGDAYGLAYRDLNRLVALPAGVATASLLVLFVQILVHRFTPPKRAKPAGYEMSRDDPAQSEPTGATREGRAHLKFESFRLLLCVVLVALSVVTAVTGRSAGEGNLLGLSLIGVYVRVLPGLLNFPMRLI